MPMLLNKHRFAILVALAAMSVPFAAQAQRKSPLADAPAIRKKIELRSTRVEIGAGAGSTVNQDFFHTVFVNVRGAFHISDGWSIAGFVDLGVAQIGTGFQGKVTGTLSDPTNSNVMREPTPTYAKAGMQQISSIFGGQLEYGVSGKYSLFYRLFSAYDFYAFAGGAGINVKPAGSGLRTCDSMAPADPGDPNRYVCSSAGTKFGPTFGVGFHSFFGQTVALGVELRDVMAQLNPSGRDVNGDLIADNNDLTWTHTWMVNLNLLVYFPSAKISP
jgi:hypothetical protein